MNSPEKDDTADACNGREGEAAPATVSPQAWPRVPWREQVVVALTLALVAALTIPRLPPGICFGDSGELQLASTVLGITHAPGYPGYVTLGYLATLLPGVSPAYMISLLWLLAGLMVVWLCILMQVRLGVNTVIACGVALAFVTVPSMWINLLAPEVYIPTLAFVAGAVYLLIKYHRLGTRRDLYMAALLFGVALANRPPVLFTLPFFVLAWWVARKRWDASWRQAGKTLVALVGLATLPMLYSLGYLHVRDTPETRYNYIENANREFRVLPDADEGWQAKVERVIYHATAQEFSYAMGNSWSKVVNKLRWLHSEFFLYSPVKFATALLVIAFGATVMYRGCRPAFWVLLGLGVGSVIFVCAYDMYGQAADYLPLLWAACIFAGVATSPLFPVDCNRVRRVVAAAFLGVVGTFAVVDVDGQPLPGRAGNALPYVTQLDMGALPKDAVICVKWPETPAIFYAKTVLTDRDDIDIISAQDKHWLALVESVRDRPVFVTENTRALEGQTLTPYRISSVDRRNGEPLGADQRRPVILWRLERDE